MFQNVLFLENNQFGGSSSSFHNQFVNYFSITACPQAFIIYTLGFQLCVCVFYYYDTKCLLGLHNLFPTSLFSLSVYLCATLLFLLFFHGILCIYFSEICLVTSGVYHRGGGLVDGKRTERNTALLGDIFWLLIAGTQAATSPFPLSRQIYQGALVGDHYSKGSSMPSVPLVEEEIRE